MSFTKEEINNFILEAFKYCEKAIENNEVPVGCIFVHNITKKILYGSHNLTNQTKNANAHCEINCIKYFESNLPYKIICVKKNSLIQIIYILVLFLLLKFCFVIVIPDIVWFYTLWEK